MPRDEVHRHHRCEFPGCRCPCIQRHSTQDICVRCLHGGAWHAPMDAQNNLAAHEEDGTHDNDSVSEDSGGAGADPTYVSQDRDEIQSQQRIIDNLLMLLDIDAGERSTCCVCMMKPCDVVLRPCGHARFCKQCIDDPRVQRCPVCRSNIRNKVSFIPL